MEGHRNDRCVALHRGGGGGRGVATVENSLLAPQKVQRRITM